MKATIRYFSGTGNTWRIASACAEQLTARGVESDIASIRSGMPPDPSADVACFCFPVHALDLPRNAFPYLRGLPPAPKSVPAILLVTGGDPDNAGWALPSGTHLLTDKGYRVQVADLIRMPINWTPFHSAPEQRETEEMIIRGVEKTHQWIERFLAGGNWLKPISLQKFGTLGSVLMRTLYHRRGVYQLWRFFNTDSRCTGCGLCARICPTESIRIESGKPVWSGGCVQCMRCFNYCPNRAIRQLEPLLHGSRHNAYHLPGFNPAAEK